MSEQVTPCPSCGFSENQEKATFCGNCGTALAGEASTGAPAPTGSSAAAEWPRSSSTSRTAIAYPGREALGALRIVGGFLIVCSFMGGIWILMEFGWTQQIDFFGSGSGTRANPLGIVSGLGFIVQGIVVGTLMIGLSAIGTNVIGIREDLDGRGGG